MNKLVQISGRLLSQPNNNPGIPIPKFRPYTKVSETDIQNLINSLMNILCESEEVFKTIKGILLSVEYKEIVAKSNRIRHLFKSDNKDNLNNHVRGSRYENDKHIFVYYLKKASIYKTIDLLEEIKTIVSTLYGGSFSTTDFQNLKTTFESTKMSRSAFSEIMADLSYIERFYVDKSFKAPKDASIISFYLTDVPIANVLQTLKIGHDHLDLINDNTAFLEPSDLMKIQDEIPYLVSMSVEDLKNFLNESTEVTDKQKSFYIPSPTNEPIVGVIDTLFDKNAYFKDWVEYEQRVSPDLLSDEEKIKNLEHGTGVTSIIVDGHSLNPSLDDGCGHFKVKHFGVAIGSSYSSFEIIKETEKIVASNREIKVWNFSLGSESECRIDSISPEAALLDRLQSEYDVIFIISGTNFSKKFKHKRVGAPADSINGIVVNSVQMNGRPASYSRTGPVLTFFQKPDISYYGGDKYEKIYAYGPKGEFKTCGTSFAAAWITRKVAFLVYKMGFSKEIAKAILLDSAYGWNSEISLEKGLGIVPIKISQLLETPNDEIKFLIQGVSKEYETFSYDIPIPVLKDKHPFFARATLCYFPKCSRNQGVDYTNTELDIHFGRIGIKDKINNRTGIFSINSNRQGDPGIYKDLQEANVRKFYRKWDSVKVVREPISKRAHGKKKYGEGLWGLSVKSKERLSSQKTSLLPFGIVVTLKEIHGKNRIDEFVKLCSFRGWIVNEIDINQRIDIYNNASVDVILE